MHKQEQNSSVSRLQVPSNISACVIYCWNSNLPFEVISDGGENLFFSSSVGISLG